MNEGMARLDSKSYLDVPWKNGLGTTKEIYKCTLGDCGAPFVWRVSQAIVSCSGPFSEFNGYDRHIMCLSGGGFVLEGGPQGDVNVLPMDAPHSFSGDWKINGRLIDDGPCIDFNLIVLREVYPRSSMQCFAIEQGDSIALDTLADELLFILSGSLTTTKGILCSANDSLLVPFNVGGTVTAVEPTKVVHCKVWRK